MSRAKCRNKRAYDKIVTLMSNGKVCSFYDILDFLNNKDGLKHGCTKARLVNILSRNREFQKVGIVHNGSYNITQWQLRVSQDTF